MSARPLAIRCLILLASIATGRSLDAAEFEEVWRPYLRGMKEPIFSSAKTANGDFQFRWTRLVGYGEPVSIRVWRTHGETFAHAVRLEFHLDYSVGRITHDQTIRLTGKQLEKLQTYISSEAFWRPLNAEEKAFNNGFLGGTHWLFEIRDSSGYRSLSMFSPALIAADRDPRLKIPKSMRSSDPYIAVATFLLGTTGIFPRELKAYR
jgi:hypothetical protein